MIGKKIISGDFDLTTICFPINLMKPISMVSKCWSSSVYFPLYFGLASKSKDPVERMKFLCLYCIASNYWQDDGQGFFDKPLNPILGETAQAYLKDGSQLFSEQVAHHPPTTYMYAVGPNKDWIYSGYCVYKVFSGINQTQIVNNGKRKIVFKDGQEIKFNYVDDWIINQVYGQPRYEAAGTFILEDEKNKVSAKIQLSNHKGQPNDYCIGEISKNDEVISELRGSYLGWVKFDGKKWYDTNVNKPHRVIIKKSSLKSDHNFRKDLHAMREEDMELAQKETEKLIQIQRNDRKLRKAHREANEELFKDVPPSIE